MAPTTACFKGELHFDLTFTLLGKSVTRKAKVVYEHTPEWPYYDLRKQAEFKGWGSTRYHIELAAVPEVYESDGWKKAAPEWFQTEDMVHGGVLTEEIWEAVDDAIDEKCKAEDAERRGAGCALQLLIAVKTGWSLYSWEPHGSLALAWLMQPHGHLAGSSRASLAKRKIQTDPLPNSLSRAYCVEILNDQSVRHESPSSRPGMFPSRSPPRIR
jgi:hypothetical protein